MRRTYVIYTSLGKVHMYICLLFFACIYNKVFYLQEKSKKLKKQKSVENINAEEYIAVSGEKSSKKKKSKHS